MPKKVDLTGYVFNKLTVIADSGKKANDGRRKWLCLCECGKEAIVTSNHLRNGDTKTCGRCYSIIYGMAEDENYMKMTFPNGTEILIDSEDYKRVKSHTWYVDYKGYAWAKIEGSRVRLHRFIIDAPDDLQVDHVNIIKTDNRKSNLRLATSKENRRNEGLRKDNTTGAKGVSYDKQCNKYAAYINVEWGKIHLGYYCTVLEASKAYDRAAEKYFGEFARLNNLTGRTPEPVPFLLPGKEKTKELLAISAR